MAQMNTTTTPATHDADELDMILRDLATTGWSSAADRALRLAKAALQGIGKAPRAEVAS